MNYKVEVLKKMIENYDMNIEMFSRSGNDPQTLQQIHDMATEQRNVAALIENDGVLDTNQVRPDSMLYAACAGADTSKW